MRPEEIRHPIEQLRSRIERGKRDYEDIFYQKKCRNLEVQVDVMFNSFCRLNQIFSDGGDKEALLRKLQRAIEEAIVTVVNIGWTNPNVEEK